MSQEDYIKAGIAAAQIREFAKTVVKKGVTLLEATKKLEEKTRLLGVGFAFPPQISCNEIAAHFYPDKDDKQVFEDQVVSVDVGTHINGFIGDTAITIDLSGKYTDLLKASRQALKEAEKILQIGTPLGEIGRVIEDTILSFNFHPVRNLSGHGLSQFNIHDKPTIPNYANKDPITLQKGMVIAIEPFASTGIGLIEEKGDPSLFTLTGKKPVRMGFVRDIQKEIDAFQGLPFATSWISKKFSENQIKYALNQLNDLGILESHPPLVERSKGIVSQAEHSFYVDDKIINLTKEIEI